MKMLTVALLFALAIVDCGSTACGPAPYIENGKVETEPGNLTGATLTCKQGYYPSNSSITCLDTGVWENATCISFNTTACGPLPYIQNGIVQIEQENLTTAILICDQGYQPSQSRINCLDTDVLENATCVRLNTGNGPILRSMALFSSSYLYLGTLVLVITGYVVWKMTKRVDNYTAVPNLQTNRRPQSINCRENLPPLKNMDSEEDQIERGTSLWENCLSVIHENSRAEEARNLLNMEILPDQLQLERACIVFGRCSETFLAICKATSEYIRAKSIEIVDVWAAYKCSDFMTSGKIKIVFVAFTKNGKVDLRVGDYNIYERGTSVYSKESEKVLTEVENAQKNVDTFTESDMVALENCVSENADTLMNNHKKLTIISPSVKKSIRFGKEQARIYDQLCIALYVHIKGLIPIAERPFPTTIGNFPTDVLEGSFTPFHGGPYVYHEQLKMGLAIHANVTNSRGDLLVGTLGGFLDHPSYGICGLTCAHVVLSGDEMLRLKTEGSLNFLELKKEVFQPVDQGAETFGRVLFAFYCEGVNGSSGMEVALLNILDRLPTNGSFPDAENYHDAGFDDENPMVYNTGKVCEVSKIRRRSEVYKYGISSEVTRGSLGFRGSVVRTTEMSGQCQTFEYRLHNQIEVLRIDGKCFALPGDSGALVFFDDNFGDSVAIGIVEGG